MLLPILAVCALVVPSGEGVAAPAAPPTNTAEPTISGRAEQGRTLSASPGSWTGTGPISFAYQWVRCGADGGRPDGGDCAIVSGATRRDHRLGSSDVGFRMRVRVTATNADGSRVAASNPTGTVVGPPVNTAPPFPRGAVVVGQVVTAEPGTWTGRTPISFSYRWLRCNSAGGECASISGAGSRSYRVTSERHRAQASLQRDGAQLARLDDRDLDRVRDRDGAASGGCDQAAERRDLDPGVERPVESPTDRVAGAVLAEPRHGSQPGDHRARPHEGHARVRRARRARVRPLDAARDDRRRPPGDDDGRLGDLSARAERELPAVRGAGSTSSSS